jgi:hypothetical protein
MPTTRTGGSPHTRDVVCDTDRLKGRRLDRHVCAALTALPVAEERRSAARAHGVSRVCGEDVWDGPTARRLCQDFRRSSLRRTKAPSGRTTTSSETRGAVSAARGVKEFFGLPANYCKVARNEIPSDTSRLRNRLFAGTRNDVSRDTVSLRIYGAAAWVFDDVFRDSRRCAVVDIADGPRQRKVRYRVREARARH